MSGFAALVGRLHGARVRIIDARRTWSDDAFAARIAALAGALAASGAQRVASRLDNGADWLALDLALRASGRVHVPLPTFFSDDQVAHALADSGAELLVTAAPQGLEAPGAAGRVPFVDGLAARVVRGARPVLPPGTACITYTSGTTGQPRGVCLGADALLDVARSLADASRPLAPARHLCLMPLSTLLENVGGLYAALLADAEIAVPALAEIGYTGSAGLEVGTLLACLRRYQPHSVILVPQLLLALVSLAEQGATLPSSLRFVAVGGGRVGPRLLARAAALGLPVFEGYGLSECGSVVCLNRPGASRAGSVGRPLPHARVSVVDGELHVAGVRCLGYLGGGGPPPGPIATGDLGHVDADGYVHVTGRRRDVFITAFGRNVSPEWVEGELLQHPLFAQAVVFGEARPANVAVAWLRQPEIGHAGLQAALDAANAALPDYARVAHVVRAAAPFSVANGQLTANGRPRRDAIFAAHAAAIARCHGDAPSAHLQDATPMPFHDRLLAATTAERAALTTLPIIQQALAGAISRDDYVAFLTQAYHHVRHTVPLLMACGARLPARLEWLRTAIGEYIEEEMGHQEWILDDLVACGADRVAVAASEPSLATELMVAYAYDTIARGNPVGFFGMVLVLEGTSVALATRAATSIEGALGLPRNAFSYLLSHGDLDVAHAGFFETLMDRLEDADDQAAVVAAARRFYRLYGDVFRGLRDPVAAGALAEAA